MGSRISVDLPQFFLIIIIVQLQNQMFTPNTSQRPQETTRKPHEIEVPRVLSMPVQVQLDSTREMLGVINAQNILIMKLLHKQNLLHQELHRTNIFSESSDPQLPKEQKPQEESPLAQNPSRQSSDDWSSSVKRKLQSQTVQEYTRQKASSQRQKPRIQVVFDAEPQSYEERSSHPAKRVQPQSKNMIKNFAKAIFRFIRKQKEWRNRALASVGMQEEQFMRAYTKLKGKILTISDLRKLWSAPEALSRAFRVISFEYLRRHCLKTVFNSRIEKQLLHVKYRRKLLQALAKPQEFTALKTE